MTSCATCATLHCTALYTEHRLTTIWMNTCTYVSSFCFYLLLPATRQSPWNVWLGSGTYVQCVCTSCVCVCVWVCAIGEATGWVCVCVCVYRRVWVCTTTTYNPTHTPSPAAARFTFPSLFGLMHCTVHCTLYTVPKETPLFLSLYWAELSQCTHREKERRKEDALFPSLSLSLSLFLFCSVELSWVLCPPAYTHNTHAQHNTTQAQHTRDIQHQHTFCSHPASQSVSQPVSRPSEKWGEVRPWVTDRRRESLSPSSCSASRCIYCSCLLKNTSK